jgi:prepilin-type N-terminal cleavage/methylation domain-containing protein
MSARPQAIDRLRTAGRRSAVAFTLIELVVVVAIISVLLGIVLPAVGRMWAERKHADAVNKLRGAITVARRMAMSPEHDEVGLLFVRDRLEDVQRIFLIERKPVEDTTDGNRLARDRFVIVDDRDYTVPAPMRAVPRYVVETGQGGEEYLEFSDEELADESFPGSPGVEWDEGQRHRNYFTIVFNGQGRLVEGRNVLIHDAAPDNGGGSARFGDRTGLPLPDRDDEPITQYFARDSRKGDRKLPIDQTGTQPPLTDLAVDAGGGSTVAINFPSVDGLLLYDDAVFRRMGEDPSSKREFLIRAGQPLYVAGVSGSVILGPIDENEVAP